MVKFVAELSINHLGMVNIAKKMITSAHEGGASYIKLKFKDVNKYYKDKSQKSWRNLEFRDYRSSLELSKDDFKEIDAHCRSLGIPWFCTVHDKEGLDFIKEFDPPFYKIASMDSGKTDLVESVKQLCIAEDKPMVISVGGKSDEFTENLMNDLKKNKMRAFVLHTVSIYPTPIGQSNINYIKTLIDKYQDDNIKIGYSGHEEGYAASLVAAGLGANMIERHICLSRDLNIHHIKCGLEPDEFRDMVRLVDELQNEMGSYFNDGFSEKENLFLKDRKYE